MKFICSICSALLILALVSAGCGKTENKSSSENRESKSDVKVSQVAGNEKSVVIQCSGMTCEGCKSSIEHQVKKVDGIKTVDADFKTNTVKATFDDGKTNVNAIKDAILSAGYKVESINE